MITKDNVQALKEAISQVTDMIDWVNVHTQSGKRLDYVKSLVQARRRLKKVFNALTLNPAIAAYGESQHGKSYIITSLLGTDEGSLLVPDDDGNLIDFITRCNMKVNETECTGVVTRFTATDFIQDQRHPVMLRLLTVADIVTLLADSFMRDITGYIPYSQLDLKKIVDHLNERYGGKAPVQDIFTEDEVTDVEEFLSKYATVTAAVYNASGYFDILRSVIRNIPRSEWGQAFAPLWKEDSTYSAVFALYLAAMDQLTFSTQVHISIKPVLNDFNDKAPTLTGVTALNGLIEPIQAVTQNGAEPSEAIHMGIQTEVLLPGGAAKAINKGLLSMMTTEAVFHISRDVLADNVSFNMEYIRPGGGRSVQQNVEMLRSCGVGEPLSKSFLRDVDILDFPGARGRDLHYTPADIPQQIVKLLLRAKVAYLFNKYSQELKLSILMLCQAHKNPTPNLIAPIVRDWVDSYIGADAKSRESILREYSVPPLFMVCTFYNKDLVIADPNAPLNPRIWYQRLNEVLLNQVIDGKTNRWFDQWTTEGRFSNTYLLRNYYYSGDSNEGGGIFGGTPENKEYDVEARIALKEIFLKDEDVATFFPNPELAWDVSSTVGNDGGYYLLKRLAEASRSASHARDVKFNRDMEEALGSIIALMETEYHDEDDLDRLKKNIATARRFDFVMRVGCEARPDFFGRLIQFLQVNHNFVVKYFAGLIRSNILVKAPDARQYEMIAHRVEESGCKFNTADTPEALAENMEILHDLFAITGPDDPLLRGIDLKALFNLDFRRRCTPSSILADHFVKHWCECLQRPESSIFFTQNGMDPIVFSDFMDNFAAMMKRVKLADRIADQIKEYADFTPAIAPENEELIAAIAANVYNSFVMNLGYDFLSADDLASYATNRDKYHLPPVQADEELYRPIASDEEQLQSLFNQLDGLNEGEGGHITRLPAYVNMNRWIAFVFMSFAVAYDTGSFDEESNALLGRVLQSLRMSHRKTSIENK